LPAYLIAHIDVTNPEAFEAYRGSVPAVIEAHGGRYVIRGGKVETLEGNWDVPRIVIIEFDNLEAARRFYNSDEYQEILPIRLAASEGSVALIEGYTA